MANIFRTKHDIEGEYVENYDGSLTTTRNFMNSGSQTASNGTVIFTGTHPP